MLKKVFKKNSYLKFLVLGLGFIILFELVLLFKDRLPFNQTKKLPLTAYSSKILNQCSGKKNNQTCYEKEVPNLMNPPINLSMEDSFQVTKLIQDQDKSYNYCHVLGHKLAANEVAKDPSQWKDVVTRCPSGVCSNGCIHGGFQERFRAESFSDSEIQTIKPEFVDLCEPRGSWSPTGLEQGSCYHALGHLTMYVTNGNLQRATQLCKDIVPEKRGSATLQLCFDGAFMQIFQPLEPEDFALIKGKEPTRENVDKLCSSFPKAERASCQSESWPLFRQELLNPDQLVKFCSKTDNQYQDRCYSALIYVLTAQFQLNTTKMKDYCNKLPSNRQGICYANTASRLIEVDYRNAKQAADLCSSSADEVQTVCFNELLKYSSYNFRVGSNDFYQMCNALPSIWKDKCLNLK